MRSSGAADCLPRWSCIRSRVAFIVPALLSAVALGTHAACPFNVSANGGAAVTDAVAAKLPRDGLLLVRYALGLRNAALTNGTNFAGTTPTSLEQVVNSNAVQLDVNGNGQFDVEDATVIARWLGGFRGAALLGEAVSFDPAALRSTAAEMEAYVAAGCPRTLFVDATQGNDGNSGASEAAAWKTIAKVNASTFSPGDKILFKRGEMWREQLALKFSGTSQNPITYGAFGTAAAPPTISAADEVLSTGWLPAPNMPNVYVTTLPPGAAPTNLYVDDIFHEIARYPNYVPFDASTPANRYAGYLVTTAKSVDRVTLHDTTLALPAADIVGATLIGKSAPWRMDATTISGFSGGVISVASAQPFVYAMPLNYGYFLRNKLWMLDAPGEWFFDAVTSNLYLRTLDGGSPQGRRVEYSQRNYAALATSTTNFVTVKDLKLTYAKLENLAFNFSNVTGNVAKSITSIGGDIGVHYGGFQNTVQDSTIDAALIKGVRTWGQDNVVERNRITRTNLVSSFTKGGGWGIAIDGDRPGAIVRNNVISDNGYGGISFYAHTVRIEGNVIDNSCVMLDDCGGIYTWAGTVTYTTPGDYIVGNTVTNVRGNFSGTTYDYSQGQGIYLDDLSHNAVVSDNTVINAANGFHLHNSYDNELTGNRVYASRIGGIMISEDGLAPYAGYIRNNVIRRNVFSSRYRNENLASSTPGYPARYSSQLGPANGFGVFDFNVYCSEDARVAGGPLSITWRNPGASATSSWAATLSTWQGYSAQDANSIFRTHACDAAVPLLEPTP